MKSAAERGNGVWSDSTLTATLDRVLGLRGNVRGLLEHAANDVAGRARFVLEPQRPVHGCGHDGYRAMLVRGARYVAETHSFDGTVALIVRPVGEGCVGDGGMFDRFPGQSVFAMHNWPAMQPNTVGLISGATMATADRVTIRFISKGGHGAPLPDCGPRAGRSPHHCGGAGHRLAQHPAHRRCSAEPVRDPSQRPRRHESGTGRGHACRHRAHFRRRRAVAEGAPSGRAVQRRYAGLCCPGRRCGSTASICVTLNNRDQARFAGDVAERLVGSERLVRDMKPIIGDEDFSFMLQAEPGVYLRIGPGVGATDDCHLHSKPPRLQ